MCWYCHRCQCVDITSFSAKDKQQCYKYGSTYFFNTTAPQTHDTTYWPRMNTADYMSLLNVDFFYRIEMKSMTRYDRKHLVLGY